MARRRARRGHALAVRRGPGTARARRRLRLARPGLLGHPRPRLRGQGSRPQPHHVLRRGADPRVARPVARRRPRPAPPGRADEPPRRREPRMAGARAHQPRRRGDPRRARPLVPRGGHERDARAGRRALDLLRRAVARVAPGEGRTRAARAEDRRPRGRRHRAPRTLRGAVPLQEVEGEAGPGEADAHRPAREGAQRRRRRGRAAHAAHPLARLRVPEAAAQRPDRPRGQGSRGRRGRQAAAREHVLRARARRARGARRPERLGEDHAPRDGARPARGDGGLGADRPRRRDRLLLPARDRAGREPDACSR